MTPEWLSDAAPVSRLTTQATERIAARRAATLTTVSPAATTRRDPNPPKDPP